MTTNCTARIGILLGLLLASCATNPPATPWIDLFDQQSLHGWQSTQFCGECEVRVADGVMHFGMGSPLTGITLTATPPTGEYELEAVAARIDGTDFFCGLTFPVGQDHLTLILGGWGGSVCGLSNIDSADASRNATRRLKGFETGRDYTVTVRVHSDRVEALLDGKPFVATDRTGHELSLRPEVELSKPLGWSAFNTEARLRSLRWRPLAGSLPGSSPNSLPGN